MKVIATAAALAALGILAQPAEAQGIHAVRPLAGYACMMLNLTEQQLMDASARVPARTAPDAASPAVGWAAATVAVRGPFHVVNGFAEALFPSGATVWIESAKLRPYRSDGDPAARCVPSEMSNGKPGFAYPRG